MANENNDLQLLTALIDEAEEIIEICVSWKASIESPERQLVEQKLASFRRLASVLRDSIREAQATSGVDTLPESGNPQ
jgi:hypothetical protein